MSSAFTSQLNAGIAELVIAKPPVNALDSQQWQALA
ncbi:MAG TPA: enoyl-CoA hydratase, partial [Pseudomonas sp.]|nr:enoyl-CoA hydratase [Pseudomonas sp.]